MRSFSIIGLFLLVAIHIDKINRAEGATTCNAAGCDAYYTESITTIAGTTYRYIFANGCPNHAYTNGLTPNTPSAQNYGFKVLATPCLANTKWTVNCQLSMLGVAFDGVALFTQSAASGCSDAVIAEGHTFDQCSGHTDAQLEFHYHIPPSCTINKLKAVTGISDSQHSPQIGWAPDGLPIYGPRGVNGVYMLPCTNPSANSADCVDSCGGHWHNIGDGFYYHYHILGVIGDTVSVPTSPLPNTTYWSYYVNCLIGQVVDSRWSSGQTCASPGVFNTPSYTPTAKRYNIFCSALSQASPIYLLYVLPLLVALWANHH